MITNIIYYMIKYNCIAAVNEGGAVRHSDDPHTKYALIASPSRLYSVDFLLSIIKAENIKNSGLSAKAVELYKDFFGVEQRDLYLINSRLNSFSIIWKNSFIQSPYLMTNSHLLRDYFNRHFGRNTIEDLRNDY